MQLVGVFTGKRAWEDWGRIRRQRAASSHSPVVATPIIGKADPDARRSTAHGKRGRAKVPTMRKAGR